MKVHQFKPEATNAGHYFSDCLCGWIRSISTCAGHRCSGPGWGARMLEHGQVRDDLEGPIPHPFGCDLPAGHDGVHSATVTWLDGEE